LGAKRLKIGYATANKKGLTEVKPLMMLARHYGHIRALEEVFVVAMGRSVRPKGIKTEATDVFSGS
jgi:hypothetical protein